MSTATAAEIEQWLVTQLAEILELPPAEIDVTARFDRYGLDSIAAVSLTGDLEDWLDYELDPVLMYDYPTIQGVAQYLAQELEQGPLDNET
jgi:acyl carrier protein